MAERLTFGCSRRRSSKVSARGATSPSRKRLANFARFSIALRIFSTVLDPKPERLAISDPWQASLSWVIEDIPSSS